MNDEKVLSSEKPSSGVAAGSSAAAADAAAAAGTTAGDAMPGAAAVGTTADGAAPGAAAATDAVSGATTLPGSEAAGGTTIGSVPAPYAPIGTAAGTAGDPSDDARVRMASAPDVTATSKVRELADERRGQKTRAPLEHYAQEFAASDPQVLARRTGLDYDADARAFAINVLGRTVGVHWPDMACSFSDDGTEPVASLKILLACLLLEGKLAPSTGKMISYAEAPWGSAYYDAFKRRCLDRLAHTYRSADQLTAAALPLGGVPAADGDASFDFTFVPGIIVRLTVWDADDEFPASTQILFSDNTPLAFSAESMAAVGDVLLNALSHGVR